ncbi:unnamed protein product [Lactuca saligna]|uniref:Uncharacterized protein n=1 Tax=Lactuca saligna TaxID=75948 RepID=A0AA35YN46_LACSI|nr:unnamed protein product [Lactuca saligna]
MDRYGILDDSFALSMASQLPLSSLLTLMGAYREEPDYTMLSNLISVGSKVARIVADVNNTLLDNIKIFFINLFQYSADNICELNLVFNFCKGASIKSLESGSYGNVTVHERLSNGGFVVRSKRMESKRMQLYAYR